MSIKNIALIGYRGCGKTTIAKKLSEELNLPIISTDQLIEEKIGESILSFLKKNTWEDFRSIESEIIQSIYSKKECILDCGGGVIERKENMNLIQKKFTIFYLKTDFCSVLFYLFFSKKRPPLVYKKKHYRETKEVFYQRLPIYEQYANFTVKTGSCKLFKAHKEIISQCQITE